MRMLILVAGISLCSCGQNSSKEKKSSNDNDTLKTQVDGLSTHPEIPEQDSLPPVETKDAARINARLAADGSKWRVVTDVDAKWEDRELETYGITNGRKKDPNYPFIILGDFNGDGKKDYAAVVTDDQQEYDRLKTRIAILLTGDKIIFIEEYNTVHSALTTIPKNSSIKGEDDKQMTINQDAIDVNNHDTGGYVIYWNGKEFKTISSLE